MGRVRITEVMALKQMIKALQLSKLNRKKSDHYYLVMKRRNDDQDAPVDVPKGHFTVYVGDEKMRYVIPTAYLHQTEFRQLLQRAEEEYGFDNPMGIIIPCDQHAFQHLLLTFP